MTRKTMVSLFAGIGGFDLGFERAGFKPIGMCEIDPNARSVLDRHWPDVPKHDDVTTLKASTFGSADVITFGSPCQDLSTAGKRAGLAGERSGLFLEAVRYIREMLEETNGTHPRFAVWENVPGAFSSNKGADFAAVLEELVGGKVRPPTRGWANAGVAFGPLGAAEWRVLDSRYFGVAQRRRRVFVVYHPGGESAGQVLLDPEGLRWDSPASSEAGESAARALTGGFSSDGAEGNSAQVNHLAPVLGISQELDAAPELVGTLTTTGGGGSGRQPMAAMPQVANALAAREGTAGRTEAGTGEQGRQWPARVASTLDTTLGDKRGLDNQHINAGAPLFVPDVAPTVTASWDHNGHSSPRGDGTDPIVPVAFKVRGGKEGGGKGYLGSEDQALTLDTTQGQYPAEPVAFVASSYTDGAYEAADVSGPLTTTADRTRGAPIAFALRGREDGAVPELSGEQINALRGAGGGSSRDYVAMIQGSAIVRSDSAGPAGSGFTEGAAFTLDTKQPHAVVFPIQDGREVEKNQNGLGVGGERDPSYTLDTTGGQAVAFAENSRNEVGLEGGDGQVVGALSTGGGKPGQGTPTIATTYAVRRLTPVECERLQAFPDDHTRYAADGTEIADTHRYRMLGNAVTVNVAHAIGNALRYAT